MVAGGRGDATRVVRRAARRLGIITLALVAAAALLAVGAGWIGAALLTRLVDVPFRWAWALLSALFFLGPSLAVLGAELRRGSGETLEHTTRKTDESNRFE